MEKEYIKEVVAKNRVYIMRTLKAEGWASVVKGTGLSKGTISHALTGKPIINKSAIILLNYCLYGRVNYAAKIGAHNCYQCATCVISENTRSGILCNGCRNKINWVYEKRRLGSDEKYKARYNAKRQLAKYIARNNLSKGEAVARLFINQIVKKEKNPWLKTEEGRQALMKHLL